MCAIFQDSGITILPDIYEFWEYCDSTQPSQNTPEGALSEAEERLDLRMAEAVKAVLEEHIGPEEGPHPVQSQNWDWNDDRTRPVFVLRTAFKPGVIRHLRLLLEGAFYDFRIILLLKDSWDSEIWGGILISHGEMIIQQAVLDAFPSLRNLIPTSNP